MAEEIVKVIVSRPKLEDGKAIDESAVPFYGKGFCACSCVQYIVCMLAGGKKKETVLPHLSIRSTSYKRMQQATKQHIAQFFLPINEPTALARQTLGGLI